MTTASMTPEGAGYYYSATVAAGQTGPWVGIPRGVRYDPVTVVGNPAGGASYRIEYTISSPTVIAADAAVPVPWEPGDKSAIAGQVIDARITAVRLVNLGGGDVEWEARV